MQMSEEMIKKIKEHLGYNNEEISKFLDNPRNNEVLSKSSKLLGKTIVIEVIEAHGCDAQHNKVGDKIYFDGMDKLLTRLCPKKTYIRTLSAVDRQIFAVMELFLAGVNPNQIHFNRAGCFDVGLECGGWGKDVLEISVVNRNFK